MNLILGLADKVRTSSKRTIEGLNNHHVRTVMLTGDTEGPAKMISNEIGMERYLASLKPHDKYEWLISQQVRIEYKTTD